MSGNPKPLNAGAAVFKPKTSAPQSQVPKPAPTSPQIQPASTEQSPPSIASQIQSPSQSDKKSGWKPNPNAKVFLPPKSPAVAAPEQQDVKSRIPETDPVPEAPQPAAELNPEAAHSAAPAGASEESTVAEPVQSAPAADASGRKVYSRELMLSYREALRGVRLEDGIRTALEKLNLLRSQSGEVAPARGLSSSRGGGSRGGGARGGYSVRTPRNHDMAAAGLAKDETTGNELISSANAYVRKEAQGDEKIIKDLTLILNKLTADNFEALLHAANELPLFEGPASTDEAGATPLLLQAIRTTFDTATFQITYASTFAKFCSSLGRRSTSNPKLRSAFRTEFVKLCRQEFTASYEILMKSAHAAAAADELLAQMQANEDGVSVVVLKPEASPSPAPAAATTEEAAAGAATEAAPAAAESKQDAPAAAVGSATEAAPAEGETPAAAPAPEAAAKPDPVQQALAAQSAEAKRKVRTTGLIRFLGELLNHRMITVTAIVTCLSELIQQAKSQLEAAPATDALSRKVRTMIVDDRLGAACELIGTAGLTLHRCVETAEKTDKPVRPTLEEIADRLEALLTQRLSSKTSYRIKDTLKLRTDGWKGAQREEQKKLSDLRAEAENLKKGSSVPLSTYTQSQPTKAAPQPGQTQEEDHWETQKNRAAAKRVGGRGAAPAPKAGGAKPSAAGAAAAGKPAAPARVPFRLPSGKILDDMPAPEQSKFASLADDDDVSSPVPATPAPAEDEKGVSAAPASGVFQVRRPMVPTEVFVESEDEEQPDTPIPGQPSFKDIKYLRDRIVSEWLSGEEESEIVERVREMPSTATLKYLVREGLAIVEEKEDEMPAPAKAKAAEKKQDKKKSGRKGGAKEIPAPTLSDSPARQLFSKLVQLLNKKLMFNKAAILESWKLLLAPVTPVAAASSSKKPARLPDLSADRMAIVGDFFARLATLPEPLLEISALSEIIALPFSTETQAGLLSHSLRNLRAIVGDQKASELVKASGLKTDQFSPAVQEKIAEELDLFL